MQCFGMRAMFWWALKVFEKKKRVEERKVYWWKRNVIIGAAVFLFVGKVRCDCKIDAGEMLRKNVADFFFFFFVKGRHEVNGFNIHFLQ